MTKKITASEALRAQANKLIEKSFELERAQRESKEIKDGLAAFSRGFKLVTDKKCDARMLFPSPSSIGLPFNKVSALRATAEILNVDAFARQFLATSLAWDIVADAVSRTSSEASCLKLAKRVYDAGFKHYLGVLRSRF